MRYVILGSIVLSMFMFVTSGLAEQSVRPLSGKHMKVSGVISKMQSGLVFITTSQGQITMSPTGGLKNLKIGEEVQVWINEDQKVVDMRRPSGALNERERGGTESSNSIIIDEATTKTDPGLIF